MIVELQKEQLRNGEFEQKTAQGLVMADFFSPSCGPCKMLGFVLRDVEKEVGADFPIYQVNYEENGELADRYGVTGYPTLVLLKDGKEVNRLQGLQQKPLIVRMIQEYRDGSEKSGNQEEEKGGQEQ